MKKALQVLTFALYTFGSRAKELGSFKEAELESFFSRSLLHSRTNLLQIQQTERLKYAQDLRVGAKTHYSKLTGSSTAEVAAKINRFVASHPSVRQVIPCEDMSYKEVAGLALKLLNFVDFNTRLVLPEDDGRQPNTKMLDDCDDDDCDQYSSEAGRDAWCAETLKLWAHHIPGHLKVDSVDVVLPSLPEYNNAQIQEENAFYNRSLSCVAGHTVVDADQLVASGKDNLDESDWPHWPSTVHWRAKGHGPYPFWQFGPPQDGWVLNMSLATPGLYNPGIDMEMWHSTPLKATKFYHSKCMWEWLGFKSLGTQACVGLQLNKYGLDGAWYIYTADAMTKASDQAFCCNSSWHNLDGTQLGTINRKFMDNMKYLGEVNISGDYYQGVGKRYIMSLKFPSVPPPPVNKSSGLPLGGHPEDTVTCPECGEPSLPVNVFYETDLQDRPVRFGEYGQTLVVDGYLHDTDLPLMYEEMDPNSFTDDFPSSVFDIPEICKTTLHGCNPGRANREKWP